MSQLYILVAPPGAGKSTLAKEFEADGFIRISQDDQGREGHLKAFKDALTQGLPIIIDRMNFSKEQRARYVNPAIEAGYQADCIVLHQNRATCLERMAVRQGHPTIKDMKQAGSALHTFFKGYQRPTSDEGFASIDFRYPETHKRDTCVIVDIDGTIANLDHRLHYINTEGKKKDWKSFLSEVDKDSRKEEVIHVIAAFITGHNEFHARTATIVCSGRGDEYREKTQTWLDTNFMFQDHLFMRERADYREDYIIKENILDFEILTRYSKVLVAFDDRDQVVKMWRRRGILCMQVANGDF